MTADQVKGKGFKGALSYNLTKVEKGVATVLDSTFSREGNLQAIIKEVALVRMQRPNLAKYFYHTSINFPVHEDLPDSQMKAIASDYLEGMGFGDNQHIIFRHFDADHPHLHILVNRIGYDGSLVSDSQDFQRSEKVLRQLETKYGLTPVISSRQAKERAMTKDEMEMMKRTDEPSIKMKLQVLVKEAMKDGPYIATFIERLERSGINVLFNQAKTGFVSGISYGYEGMQFKGAHLGNGYKWQSIKTQTSYEQERDRTTIHKANLRTAAIREKRGYSPSTGIRTNAKAAQSSTNALQRSNGKLQGELQQGNGKAATEVPVTRNQGSKYQRATESSSRKHGNVDETAKQDRQQVDHPALPHSGIISGLLSNSCPDPDTAPVELTQSRRKRKKKRRGLSQ